MKIIKNKLIKSLSITVLLLNINACNMSDSQDGPPRYPVDLSHVKEPIPKVEPKSKYGNPEAYSVFGKKYKTMKASDDFSETGKASWYGTKFHGKRTSSGEKYDMFELTGAHKSLPLPTYARVTNVDNNKSIIVKINDRGPFHDDRILDLSYAAAAKLGVLGKGTANVKLTTINPKQEHKENKGENHNKKGNTGKKMLAQNKSPSNDLVRVQIGAFTQKQHAEKLIKNVAKVIDQPIKISANDHSSSKKANTLFKVHIGPIPSEKLNQVKEKLADINIKNPIVISSL